MSTIRTPVTDLLNVVTPVISAPMGGATSGALAAKVTLAGGFGFIAAGFADANTFKSDLELARSVLHDNEQKYIRKLRATDAVKSLSPGSERALYTVSPTSVLPIGVGYLGWILDQSSDSSEKITLALEARVAAIWFSFGNDLRRWIDLVRDYDSKRTTPHQTLVFVLVNSVEEALRAAKIWKVDVIVAQGNEAGGHGHSQSPPLLSLLPAILKELPNGPPVLAAGGIATGAQLAAILTLGAAGAVVGTRFLLTPESVYSDKQKRLLLAADAGDTVRSVAFDVARGTTGWPSGIDGRALRNGTVDNYDAKIGDDEVQKRFATAVREGQPAGTIVWAGSSVGLVSEIKDAYEIVKELHEDASSHLQRAAYIVTTDLA